MSKDNQGAIFIASFSEQLIREKVIMSQPDDDDPWYQEKYEAHIASRRTFHYDVKEEQDGKEIPESEFRLQYQWLMIRNEERVWEDCTKLAYEHDATPSDRRRIIAIPIEPDTPLQDEGDMLSIEVIKSIYTVIELDGGVRPPYKWEVFLKTIDEIHRIKHSSPPEPSTPLQPVKDEGAMAWLKREGYPDVMPMTLDNLGIILDRYTKYLSSPPEPSSKEQEGDQYFKTRFKFELSKTNEQGVEIDYWKKRCEAAENYLGSYYDVYSNSEKYKKWQELKNKNL